MTAAPLPSAPVGRLAPSPTGLLHLGHARTFLCAWWSVRARGGRILMRIEDLDAGRAEARFADASLRDLEWLGLDWDGTPSVQSAHLERFDDARERLLREQKAYACVCTRKELRSVQSAPHAGDSEPRYPGTCRGLFDSPAAAERASGRSAGIRLKVPAGPVTVTDAVAGDVAFDVQADVGDFLIARRDGAPAYQLAVAVDDAAEGVTEVVRGDDLLPSAARQRHVQDALGLPHPSYLHVALVTDERGERLAKRSDALSLAELRARGADPRTIVGWAAESLGLGDGERATASSITAIFRPNPRFLEPLLLGPALLGRLVTQRRG